MSDVLDTRELLEELRALRDEEDQDLDPETMTENDRETWEIDQDRIDILTDLLDAIGDEAQYGVALIPEDDFEEYAQQLAEDVGAINEDASWPARHINWKAAAQELRQDYQIVTFDGDDYLYRA